MKRFTMLFGLGIMLFISSVSLADIPKLINFQGILRDGSGNPVADGVYTVRFRIYDDSTAGSTLWEETVPVPTTSGLFSVRLGDGTALPHNLFSMGANRFVGIKVNLDAEMTPRTRLISVPFAFHALRSDSAATATVALDLTCTGCVVGGVSGAILDGSITSEDLGTNSVAADEIAAGAVGTSEIDPTQVQRRVTGTAGAGEYITGINQDGSVSTAVDQGATPSGWTDDGTTVRLTTGGDAVGIGTASPTKKLEVAGSVKADTVFSNNLSSNSPLSLQAPAGLVRMYVDDVTGHIGIGIGTSAPEARLHIRGSSPARGILIENTAGVNSDDIRIKRPGTESPTNPRFSFSQRFNNTDLWLYGYDGTTFKNFIGFNYASNVVSIPADGNNLYVDNASGNVGIGTASPAQKLDVAGNIRLSGSTLLFSGDGEIATNGTLLSLNVAGGDLVMSTTGGGDIRLHSGGNVGIGTTTNPVNKLDVEGGAAIGTAYSGTSVAPTNGLLVEGNVGIGTTTPANKLDVEGGAVIGASFSGTNTAPANGLLVEGRVGIGTTSPGTKLQVEDQISSSVTGAAAPGFTFTGDLNTGLLETVPDELGLATNGSDRLHITSGGDVGIGTASPAQKLDVVGNAQVSGTCRIGGGTPIVGVLSATAVLDFPLTAAQSSSEFGLGVAGTAVGDVVSLGTPATAGALSNSCYTAFCSIAGLVTIRFNNYSAAAQNPAAGTFRVMVTKF